MSESKGIVIEEQELREMARSARGCIQRIFLHWSGGHYGANEDAYHLCVDRDGKGPHLAAQQQCGSHQPAVRLRR